MDTFDTPKPVSIAASAPPLAADDPRLTPDAIEYRRANGIAERDQYGDSSPAFSFRAKAARVARWSTIANQPTKQELSVRSWPNNARHMCGDGDQKMTKRSRESDDKGESVYSRILSRIGILGTAGQPVGLGRRQRPRVNLF